MKYGWPGMTKEDWDAGFGAPECYKKALKVNEPIKTKNEYLYGKSLFGDDTIVREYYRRKKESAKELLSELQKENLRSRDTIRISKVLRAIHWCDERISEIDEALK